MKDSAVAKQNSYRAALEIRMIQLLVDENFNRRILRGLRRRIPGLNFLLVQDTELFQTEDPQFWIGLRQAGGLFSRMTSIP